MCCRKSSCTNADDVRQLSDNISMTATSVPRTSQTSVNTSTNVHRNTTNIMHSDTEPSLAVMRPPTSPANQRTETMLTSVDRENDSSDAVISSTVRRHSAVTHSVMPNTQRNSSQFTFANSLLTSTHRTTDSNHRIANDAHPDKAKVSRSSIKQPSNKDSLPEFSVEFDVTASTFSRDLAASSTDFCPSVTSSFNTRSASAHQNERNVSGTTGDHRRQVNSVNDVTSLMKNNFNRTSLEPLLGKERMQRLLQNLRDIDLVSTPTHHHHHHHQLSQSADKYQASRPTVNCWASTSATTYETRTSGLHATSSSVVDEERTSADLHEARMSDNVHKEITSSLRTSSGLREKICTVEGSEMEEDAVKKMTSSLGLLLRDCISSSSSAFQHVTDTRNMRGSDDDDDDDDDGGEKDEDDEGVAGDDSLVRHHIDATTNTMQHR